MRKTPSEVTADVSTTPVAIFVTFTDAVGMIEPDGSRPNARQRRAVDLRDERRCCRSEENESNRGNAKDASHIH
jgi:hypothetical protein